MDDNTAPIWTVAAEAAARAKLMALTETIGADFLHTTTDGRYQPIPAWYWTSGFWPGLIRLLLEDGPDARLEAMARDCEDRLWAILSDETFFELHHDVGFQFLPTAVRRYRQTGARDARQRGVVAAHLLMGRFNVASGAIEAWNVPQARGYVIIDALMNLPILTWASEETGEPRFANVARVHVETVLKQFIRADGSSHHIIAFDQRTGARLAAHGGQGAGPDSAWSRGQAWAIYGLALAAKNLAEPRYAVAANRVADRFLALNEGHGVPPWDFRADAAAEGPRDSSAAAIAACGLLELAEQGRAAGRAEAETLLAAVTRDCAGPGSDALLQHGTSNLPSGFGIDVGLIYGDYYYYEALCRLNGRPATRW